MTKLRIFMTYLNKLTFSFILTIPVDVFPLPIPGTSSAAVEKKETPTGLKTVADWNRVRLAA
jgi:hypothetical protein